MLRVDFGGIFDGYLADLARTMVVGHATQEQRDTYARLWQVQQETITAVCPGARASDVCGTSLTPDSESKASRPLPRSRHS